MGDIVSAQCDPKHFLAPCLYIKAVEFIPTESMAKNSALWPDCSRTERLREVQKQERWQRKTAYPK